MSAGFSEDGRLTKRQALFCREYIRQHFNGKKAAIAAGYAPDNADVTASKLLAVAKVRERVDQLREKFMGKVEDDIARIVGGLREIADVDVTDAYDDSGKLKSLRELPEGLRRSIQALEVHELFAGQGEEKTAIGLTSKLKFHDKVRAKELLGRFHGIWKDKVEHSGTVTLEQLVAGQGASEGNDDDV